MVDPAYVENLLRERACPLCGADRKARRDPDARACAVCGTAVPAGDEKFAVSSAAACAVCSTACLETALHEVPQGALACPMCGSPWLEAAPAPRTCAICGTALDLEDGYAGLWRGGRAQAFCGATCLDAYLTRANPFCG